MERIRLAIFAVAGSLLLAFGILVAFTNFQQTSFSSSATPLPSGGLELYFTAPDGARVSALYFDSQSKDSVVLFHQLSSSKESFANLSRLLAENFTVLAVDLRGHGKTEYKPITNFEDADYLSMLEDARGATKFLVSQGKRPFAYGGASIGANIALVEAVRANASKAFLLSPGLDYRGIGIGDASKNFAGSLLVVSSEGDAYSHDSSEAIMDISQSENKEFVKLSGSAHGTVMLNDTIAKKISDFLTSTRP